MPFTKDDKILIKNLFELKGHNAKHCLKYRPYLQVVAKAIGCWVGQP